ncbi:hypothetical protein V495_04018 [Pseudogymnoascus sp. VKM F-4514 (FW-929)]|nr:hypothetical protein V495_04018 [Pseudogymnoascus sp. VKM F-4514 (FW-929)]KFY53986.1 hypothetical protein V497_08082 [Pseudogymnoascus sp. VKM F-4516 (FW-969)]
MQAILIFLAHLVAVVNAEWPPPEPCTGYCNSHDPSVIRHTNGTYFRFSSSNKVATSESLQGPWTEQPGFVDETTANNGGAGAPDVKLIGDTYYLYYQHTLHGDRVNSNISVATSPDMSTGSWKTHGNLSIPLSPNYNKIDANILVIPAKDESEKESYLVSFGSFWQGIFQIPLRNPPLEVKHVKPTHLERNLTGDLQYGDNPSEGAFQFMWQPKGVSKPLFYLFFSSGYCCERGDIEVGSEYKIMVCRSEGPSGPFVDKEGRSCLTENGGTLIYGTQRQSSRGIVYAPGGQGVMYDKEVDGGSVVLYYHYIANFTDVHRVGTFGWNKLDFDITGWPEVRALSSPLGSNPTGTDPTGTATGTSAAPTGTGESSASRLSNPIARINGDASLPQAASTCQCVQASLRDDGLPLVALPVNPNPFQRPHSRARDILGYHQYLYRTLPILFPVKAYHFWRDFLCEAAWETEWVFDAIVALGTMHRATLLLSQHGKNDRDRGLDTKIIAIQTYIRALEGVSHHLTHTSNPAPLAVGVLVLMAYIECLSGNIPAAIRHTQVIQCYSHSMKSDDKRPISNFVSPIESSIRDLELICRIVRPFPSPLEPRSVPNADKSTVNLPSSFFEIAESSSSILLQQLLEFTSADLDLKHLVWCVYSAHYQSVSKDKLLAFLQALDEWKAHNSTAFKMLNLENSLLEPIDFSYQALGELPFPPACHEKVPRESCLMLALYTFYKARLLWALCLLGDHDGKTELDAYYYVYQFLRYTRTALATPHQTLADGILPCENLRIGFSPLLYLAGRCCPKPSWLRWIIQELETIGQEGLFHNKPFATTLNILLSLEEHAIRNSNPSPDGQKFVPPRSRTITLYIPDIDGRSSEAYYALPQESPDDHTIQFNLSRIARWSDTTQGSAPIIQDYEMYQQKFSDGWLFEQPLVQKWLDWNCGTKFDLSQVIRDHIAGNRVLLEIGM